MKFKIYETLCVVSEFVLVQSLTVLYIRKHLSHYVMIIIL